MTTPSPLTMGDASGVSMSPLSMGPISGSLPLIALPDAILAQKRQDFHDTKPPRQTKPSVNISTLYQSASSVSPLTGAVLPRIRSPTNLEPVSAEHWKRAVKISSEAFEASAAALCAQPDFGMQL